MAITAVTAAGHDALGGRPPNEQAASRSHPPEADQHSGSVEAVVPPVAAPSNAGSPAAEQSRFPRVLPSLLLPRWLGAAAVQIASLVLGVLLWYWVTEIDFKFIINFENVPGPLAVYASLVKQLAGFEFYSHIGASLRRIATAYSIAAVLGILLGLAMGRSRIVRNLVMPYVEILRPIPAVAWIPLAILMWPTEESSIIYITFLGALFPIILNTMAGVEQAPEVLVRAARSLGAKRLQVFRHVILPAAFPSIATGLAVGMGVAWFSLLAGEIISGQYGIGYFTWRAYHLIKYPEIVVGMLAIGLLGTGSTFLVRLLTSPMVRWQRKMR